MPIYKLKDGKHSLTTTKPIEYVNGKWLADGKRIGDWTLSQIQFKDVDGYYKTPMPNGSLAVQDVDDNGNPIKRSYIGGTKQQTRDKFWKQSPIIRHAIDSIANEYKISPSILRARLNHEGFVDEAIKSNNHIYNEDSSYIPNYSVPTYKMLNSFDGRYNGFNYFGLDDVADFIEEGKVKLKNENWFDNYNENEHGRIVHSANGEKVQDNIGIMAATLQYMQNQAKKDFPNASRRTLDEAVNVYFNKGITAGKKYIQKRYKKK